MPELPDVTVYLEALEQRVRGQKLLGVRLASPFVLRTFDPPISAAAGRTVTELRRVGKRLALRLSDAKGGSAAAEGTASSRGGEPAEGSSNDLWLVIHLMISGRLRWEPPETKVPGKLGLAAFDFPRGTLVLTEAASKKRASIHVVRGEEGVRALDRGGVEPLGLSLQDFKTTLLSEGHTLKRALTDPRLFAGIGNAYSDEILHRAKLSPVQLVKNLDDAEIARLHAAVQTVLVEWTDRLRAEAQKNGGWPEKVTAFRPEMAVHGKFRQPCPVCGTTVQRIAYADNETDYCPRCQTEGRLLSDRGLARLLKEDWPRTVEELEEKLPTRAAPAAPKPKAKKLARTFADVGIVVPEDFGSAPGIKTRTQAPKDEPPAIPLARPKRPRKKT